jgi:hypothetical protein
MAASSDKTYTLDDLANALLDARRYERAAEELRDYFVPRAATFRQAFGMAGDHGADPRDPRRHLGHLLDRTVRSMLSFSSPTSGYLEAPRELVEFAERFRPDISRASAELDRELRKMLLALLEELVAPGRTTVTGRDLLAHGFDPATKAPDPDDFW